MPIYSQAQARFEFAHPEKFDRERVRKQLRRQGGLHRLPERKSGRLRNRRRLRGMLRSKIANRMMRA